MSQWNGLIMCGQSHTAYFNHFALHMKLTKLTSYVIMFVCMFIFPFFINKTNNSSKNYMQLKEIDLE